MAFASIDYTAAIWQSLGLKYIFKSQVEVGRGNWENVPPPSIERPRGAHASWSANQYGAAKARPESASQAAARAPVARQFQPVAMEQWGALWRERFAGTKPGKIAWTYWQLASDILGEKHPFFDNSGRNRRRNVMMRLLKALEHPAGTHTFWPAQMDLAADPKADPEIFWSGLKLLGCRGLLIFGSQAAWPLLNTKAARPLNSYKLHGVFVYVLNDLDLLADDEAQLGQTGQYLRSSLRMFVR